MADSLLNTSKKWTTEFADTLIARNFGFQWYGMFRADNIDLKFAKKLKKSGLCRALIGAEAYTDEGLEKMQKQTTSEDNLRASEAFCAAGIPLEISNIIGFPGESERDFQVKQEFYYNLSEKYTGMFAVNSESFRFVPGSGVYKDSEKFNIKVLPWDQETIDAIPEISDAVAKLPMAVISEPDNKTIIRWRQLMDSNFRLDKYSRLKFQNAFIIDTVKTMLRGLSLKSQVRFTRNFSLNVISQGKIYEVILGKRPMLFISKREQELFRALQNTKDIQTALNLINKTHDNLSIESVKSLLNKLVKAGVLPNIVNPLPESDKKADSKILKNLKVTTN